ncbi:MAG TPA: HAMP domain-containing sensor histidine kinase [Polyangiaceae bacterium]
MPLAAVVGFGIEIATVAALWDRPRAATVSVVSFVAMMGFTVLFTKKMTAWGAKRVELVRLVMSVTVSVLTNHYTGWPMPTWLWLPYNGLAMDGNRRWNWIALVTYMVPIDAMALVDGVSLRRCAMFTVLAILARLFTDARLDVLREMFEQSEAHRLALDEAHAKLKAEIAAREATETGLRRAQKLEAVGRLASGIAHEINTPIQFVNDSVHFLADATDGFMRVIDAYAKSPALASRVAADVDLPFLMKETPEAIRLTQLGLDRITAIVRSMRQISYADKHVMEHLDLNQAVTTAVTLAASECKPVAEVETCLAELPPIQCHGGEIMQVLLNLIVNAAHAIGETKKRGVIRVVTEKRGDAVVVSVSDTGRGIPAHVQDRIFEPFFTTKAIGKGTGQGLAIARSIVLRHGGGLTFDTSANGTTFHVSFPFARRDASTRAA